MAPFSLPFLVALSLLLLFFQTDKVDGSKECKSAPLIAEDRRVSRSRLRIATYNAEWLFLGSDSKNCPGSGCAWSDQSSAKSHLQRVADEIIRIDPDIINLVEIESCDVLIALNTLLGENQGYKPYLLLGTDTATHQNVGLLTRIDPIQDLQRSGDKVTYPVSGSKCRASANHTGSKTLSKHYWTKFMINGEEFNFFGIHLLAFPTDPTRCSEREAQASVLASFMMNSLLNSYQQQLDILQATLNGDPIHEMIVDKHRIPHTIVLGDFNDYDELVLDASDNVPTSRVLRIISQALSSIYSVISPNNDGSLFNVESLVQKSQRYSNWWNANGDCQDQPGNSRGSIDHILMSPELAERIKSVRFAHDYPNGCGISDSDHWPIVVELQL